MFACVYSSYSHIKTLCNYFLGCLRWLCVDKNLNETKFYCHWDRIKKWVSGIKKSMANVGKEAIMVVFTEVAQIDANNNTLFLTQNPENCKHDWVQGTSITM